MASSDNGYDDEDDDDDDDVNRFRVVDHGECRWPDPPSDMGAAADTDEHRVLLPWMYSVSSSE